MYKLIVIDLDGTLLNTEGNISEENRLAINRAMNEGIKVIIASGRITMSVRNFALESGAYKYCISGNGSEIFDIENNRSLYSKYLSKNKVLNIVQICEENSISFSIYTESGIITSDLAHNVLFYYHENKKKDNSEKVNINIVENISKYIKTSGVDKFLKFTICDSDASVFSSIIRKLRAVRDVDVLDVGHASRKTISVDNEKISIEYYYTEITNKNINKWSALEYLMLILNVEKEDIIAIGDNINDKEMIVNSGLGVVMGNSAPYIKNFADIVVSDNNNNGVAEIIEKILNKNIDI